MMVVLYQPVGPRGKGSIGGWYTVVKPGGAPMFRGVNTARPRDEVRQAEKGEMSLACVWHALRRAHLHKMTTTPAKHTTVIG